MNTNTERFIADQEKFFSGSYEQFAAFGGPCVYFHRECLQAGQEAFLSKRHIEMLYATLTAWGMHRMGDSEMSEAEYSDAVFRLRPHYNALDLSVSNATIVANSKALHHLFPDFIPPIDRQYTIRFFRQLPEKWRDAKRRFRAIQLPAQLDAQFDLFHRTCVDIKRLADRVDATLFKEQCCQYGVTAPKAIDNAIVNYVRIVSGQSANGA